MGRLHRRFIRAYDEKVVHTLTDYQFVLTHKMSTYDIDGDYIDIDADYAYSRLVEFRAQVTSWAGCGNEFKTLYTRASADITNAVGYLQGVTFISRVEEAVDLFGIRSLICEVSLKAGGQTIDWVRGAEICIDSSTPTDPTVNITHFKILQVETQLQSDVAPTSENVGLWFEYDSAAAASLSNWHDIRLAAGPRIFSAAGAPVGANEPFLSAPVGSLYLRNNPADKDTAAYVKYANAGADADWAFITTTSL